MSQQGESAITDKTDGAKGPERADHGMTEVQPDVTNVTNVTNVDAPETRHVLSCAWRWLYKPTIVYKQQTEEDWLSDYQPVLQAPIDSLETFWGVYLGMPTLSALDCGNIYAVFRNGISASWEDKANENGFSVVLYMNRHVTDAYMKMLYQNSLFVAIGNNTPFSRDLNGCTFERKSGGNKVVFWMGCEQPVPRQMEMAAAILKALQIPENDVSVVDEELRIDWRDAKFANKKIMAKCVSHRKRATEPVVARRNDAPRASTSSASSSNGQARRGRSPRGSRKQTGRNNRRH